MLSGRAQAIVSAIALALALALFGSAALAAAMKHPGKAVTDGFVGVNVDGPMYPQTAPGINLNAQFAKMEQSGVGSVRLVFDWATAQPYAKWAQVPAGDRSRYVDQAGVPTDFSQTDSVVALAARYGLSVLPTIMYAPAWDSAHATVYEFGRPADDRPYATYAADLVRRYGPGGTFWRSHRRSPDPIHQWQIWNEPNIPTYWPTQPFAASYVALLKAAARAIRGVDSRAEIVLAGIPNYSWLDLKSIYRIRGARAAFDVVAVHPYTAQPAGVITILRFVRQVMDRNGDAAKPMIADEISWPSSLGKPVTSIGRAAIATRRAGQARKTAAVIPMLAAARQALGLSAFYYYTWAGAPQPRGLLFEYAGLFDYLGGSLVVKPAFGAFTRAALAIEHCRRKGPLATQCAVQAPHR